MRPAMDKSKGTVASLLIITLFLCCIAIYFIPLFLSENIGTGYIYIHLLMTGIMVWVWYHQILTSKHLLIVGIGLRLALLPLDPLTSNDVERYLWDGAVLLSGFDPYRISPDDPIISSLRAVWPTPAEHGAYATIYPPGAIILFAISALAGPELGVWVWKSLTTLASITALIVIYKLLQQRSTMRHLSLFALSPLLILETGVGGHIDIFLVLSIVLTLAALEAKRFSLAGAVLALGTSIKFIPILIAGPIILAIPYKRTINFLGCLFLTLLLIYGLTFLMGYQPIGIVGEFFSKWRGGAPVFAFLDYYLDMPFLMIALVVLVLLIFGTAAILSLRGYLVLAMMITLAAPLLVSPIVYPWYLSVLVPFLALRPTATVLLWTTVVPLGYVVLNDWLANGIWAPPNWPVWMIGLALLLGLLIDFLIPKFTRNGEARSPQHL